MLVADDVQRRKDHHIDVVLDEPVRSPPAATGLGGLMLEYDALPEVDLDSVDLSTTVLGRALRAPIIIGAMTGGTARTGEINRVLAMAAARVGVGMALGSQRAMWADPSVAHTFAVKEHAPDLPLLIGNMGAVQLNYGLDSDGLNQVIEAVGADALNFHLNALQEAIQPEGDTRFSGLFGKLGGVIPHVGVPCLVKEVGAGISAKTAAKLARLPLAGVEVAGVGGTSWAAVESYRAGRDPRREQSGRRLAGFGVPTAASVRLVRGAFPQRLVVASGGIATGMDAAVALALGADAVALAGPLLRAATEGVDAVVQVLESLIFELRVIAFCTGSATLSDLQAVQVMRGPDYTPV